MHFESFLLDIRSVSCCLLFFRLDVINVVINLEAFETINGMKIISGFIKMDLMVLFCDFILFLDKHEA